MRDREKEIRDREKEIRNREKDIRDIERETNKDIWRQIERRRQRGR